MATTVIVFDFDGTIADTYDAILAIANRLSGEFGYKPVNKTELAQLKQLSSREIIKQSEISIFTLPFLLRRLKEELTKEIIQLNPILGIDEVLYQLKKQGYQLGIITSNIEANVVAFLKANNLLSLFDFIFSGTTIFGKHKVINQFLKQNHLTTEQVIYVGDETRDIKAAKKSKVKVIAVSWGFNSPSVLAQYQPDFLIHKPQELMKVIEIWGAPCQQAL
ncbi:MAG: HAD-IA family hydrolase [Prochloraceae cyanobacterium]